MVCQTDCHKFGVASSNFQSRLRAMGRQARRVRWPSLTVKMSISSIYGNGLDLQTKSAVSLEIGLSIYGIFRGCVLYKYSPRPQIASKPWEWMKISIHPHCESGWWWNTIPMDWILFWVQMNKISGYFQKGAN